MAALTLSVTQRVVAASQEGSGSFNPFGHTEGSGLRPKGAALKRDAGRPEACHQQTRRSIYTGGGGGGFIPFTQSKTG